MFDSVGYQEFLSTVSLVAIAVIAIAVVLGLLTLAKLKKNDGFKFDSYLDRDMAEAFQSLDDEGKHDIIYMARERAKVVDDG